MSLSPPASLVTVWVQSTAQLIILAPFLMVTAQDLC